MQSSAALTGANNTICLRDHEGWLHRLALRFKRGPVQIDDLLQEGRLAVWQAQTQWRGESSFKTFAYGCAFASMLRFSSKQLSSGTDEVFDEAVHSSGVPVAAEDSVFVAECLEMLSDRERAITLRWLQGETPTEIAKSFSRDESWIRLVLRSAFETIREKV
jgi:RNA polymerase sigma factor (sigma-70 family)